MGNEDKAIEKLLSGPLPVELLLQLQASAAGIEHGSIELIFTGKGAGIDVAVKNRLRFARGGS